MSSVEEVRKLAEKYPDPLARARRIYLDEQSHVMDGKQDSEFAIKQEIAEYFDTDFRKVAFTGSAQLGFSPQKGTKFRKGVSDLDVACIDNDLYQKYWMIINEATRAFNDLSGFSIHKDSMIKVETLKEMMVKRGVIYHFLLPKCTQSDRDASFLDSLSRDYGQFFKKITVAIYINEYAFCWKQNSALENIMRPA